MKLQTKVETRASSFKLSPCCEVLCVGSCFASNIAKKLEADKFRVCANPFGVMYNPVSVLHTIDRLEDVNAKLAILTFGTNHVYQLKESGEIVDNCEKRPQSLFNELVLSVQESEEYIVRSVENLKARCPEIHVVLTVSPIRYQKYGFHESQLSKSTLLLAVDRVVGSHSEYVEYFPAYEIINDELRDYRFYASDMIHPSDQAVDYIYERFSECFFSEKMSTFLSKWNPLRRALEHKPFNPEGDEYKKFIADVHRKVQLLSSEYNGFVI